MPPANKRFLEGPFAPVTEEITAFDLPVTGQVPAELNGRYLRNGPNPLGLDDPNYHWFLGTGMVHGVRLRDGEAEWYRNRWVRSQAVAASPPRGARLSSPRRFRTTGSRVLVVAALAIVSGRDASGL